MTDTLAPPAPPPADGPDLRSAVVAGRYEVLFAREVAEYALGPAKAYQARGAGFPGEPGFVAWVVPRSPGPKGAHLRGGRSVEDPAFAMVAHGPVGRVKHQEYAVVYPKPAGRVPRNRFGRFAAAQLLSDFLKPAVQTLRDLRSRRLVHGHILPENLYLSEGDANRILLGPACLLPDGFASRRSYQTVERAMADPIGRGPATYADDIFSLGMTLYVLATGDALDDGDEMMRRRLAFGTASSLLQPPKIPAGLHDLIEGMVADDPAQRWSLEEIGEALGGRRPARASGSPLGQRALPPLEIGSMTVQSKEEMLWAIACAPEHGARLWRDGTIAGWMANRARGQAAEESAGTARGDDDGSDDRTIASAIATVAPRLPVPFRGIRFRPEAFGALMRKAFEDPETMDIVVDFARSPLLDTWMISAETGHQSDPEPLRAIRKFRQTIATAPEYALYRLDGDAPCMAAGARGAWLDDVAAVSGMIDASCAEGAGKPDGHLIAFLAARADLDDRLFADPESAAQDFASACTYLDACAAIQHAAGGRAMPNLGRTAGPCAQRVLDTFRAPGTRQALALEIDALLQAGDLVRLADRLLDIKLHNADEHEFLAAKQKFDSYTGLLSKSDAYRLDTARRLDEQSRDYVLAFAGLVAAGILLATFFLLANGTLFPPAGMT